MRIHEYQAKQILSDFGVPVPLGKVATDPDEAAEVFESLGGGPAVVKAQSYGLSPEGGRGVGLARSPRQAASLARRMIGKRFGAGQLPSRPVTKVLVEQLVEAERSLYLAVVMDPRLARPVMLAGATEPERDPGTIPAAGVSREVIDPRFGTLSFQWRKLTAALGLDKPMLPQVTAVASGLYRAFIECECIEAEIAKLALSPNRELVALEARLRFDDNALFRHDEIASLRDPDEFTGTENSLLSNRMRYVPLGGRIGCVMFDTGSALVLLDRLVEAGARPGGLLYLAAGDSPDKTAYGITCLLREESFRAVIIEIPAHASEASQTIVGVRLALAQPSTGKQVVILATSDAAFKAAQQLGPTGPTTRVVRTEHEAAAAVGRD